MYIRTKDGVYEIREEINYYGKMFYYIKSKPPRKAFEECEILNQSENLAELCDEFVLIERNAKPIIFKTLQGAINNKIYDDEIIYGAIWTDKGLQFVARMNSKGELELK